eukprot:TRINITY_DN1707_c0_g1_i1.p1 TRINITY_DN1707_c0_g1~~TRINITY_DN1707_c0_g1_i1.p1  ORF type:complete len:604 (-),score=136.76 TRINITY_DN1707_c0_g1_i1:66-1877(-)
MSLSLAPGAGVAALPPAPAAASVPANKPPPPAVPAHKPHVSAQSTTTTTATAKSAASRREEAVLELIKGEAKYVNNLKAGMNLFLIPMKTQAQQNAGKGLHISQADTAIICSNFDKIVVIHVDFLKELEAIKAGPNVGDCNIGAVFLKMCPQLSVYEEYVNNFKLAADTLERVKETEKGAQYIQTLESTNGDLNLQALISIPLNHLSTYERNLSAVLHATDHTHPDSKNLQQVCEVMKQTADIVGNALQAGSERADLQRRLIGAEESGILRGNRKLLKEGGPFMVRELEVDKNKARFLFLLDTCLVLARPDSGEDKILARVGADARSMFDKAKSRAGISKKVGEKSHFKYAIDLSATDISDLPDTQNIKTAFGLVQSPDMGRPALSFVVQCDSVETKREWITAIRSQLDVRKNSKIFGVSLFELTQRENCSVPRILSDCIDFVMAYGTQSEGIFRLSGDAQEVSKLKALFNVGEPVILKDRDPNVVAGVLKLWLRELPDPLLTYDLYEHWIETDTIKDRERRQARVRELLEALPVVHRDCLYSLLDFCAKLSKYQSYTKMGTSNLAIVMGPNILRAPSESIATTLQIPLANNVVQNLIELYVQ